MSQNASTGFLCAPGAIPGETHRRSNPVFQYGLIVTSYAQVLLLPPETTTTI
jgi:hypothetical protein